jgi:hypothetical protein
MTTRDRCQAALQAAGRRTITTEIVAAPVFYCAEDCHPQYRAKNPNGICVIGGCGVPYTLAESPVGGKRKRRVRRHELPHCAPRTAAR